jgi:hypothetical protein
MAVQQGPSALFCSPNRIKCIQMQRAKALRQPRRIRSAPRESCLSIRRALCAAHSAPQAPLAGFPLRRPPWLGKRAVASAVFAVSTIVPGSSLLLRVMRLVPLIYLLPKEDA